MKTTRYTLLFAFIASFFTVFGIAEVQAQGAGVIFQPASTAQGRTILDPNLDGNVFHPSPNTFEIAFQPLPQLQNEPSGDPRTGATNGHTDMLSGPLGTESPTYMFWDATNERFIFRVRLGKASSASKGYSFLFNVDPSTTGFGPESAQFSGSNPGFQMEIALLTGFGVRIFNHVNGTSYTVPGGPQPYWHVAVAEETSKVFYDFYVDLAEIQKGYPNFTASSTFRVAATTVTSAQSGVSGSGSDISGIVDGDFNSTLTALIALINSSPVVNPGTIDQMAATKPRAPAVFGPLLAGNPVTVNGSSFDTDVTIRLFVNGVEVATTTTFTGNNWSISGLNLAQDDKVYAIATRAGVDSDQSTTLFVGAVTQCTVAPVNFSRAGGDLQGTLPGITGVTHSITGNNANNWNVTTNLTIRVYNPDGTLYRYSGSSVNTGIGQTVIKTWNSSTQVFTLHGTGQEFGSSMPAGYYVTAQLDGQCESSSGIETGVKTAAPVITTSPINVGALTVSGTAVAGSSVLLYQNGVQIGGPVTATGGNWTIDVSAVTLVEGRQITARAQSAGQILSDPSNIVQVGTIIQTTTKPYITGQYSQKANVTITGFSFEPDGTTIRVYVDDVLVGQTTVDIFGNWSLAGVSLTGKNTIKANAQAEGKLISPFSDVVNITGGVVENTSPPEIFGNANEIVIGSATPVTGTGGLGTVRIYLNGTQVATGSGASFSIAIPGTINPGDEIYATNQESGKFESVASNTVLVVVPANDTKYLAIKSVAPDSVDSGGAKTATFTYTVRDNNFALQGGVTVEFEVVNGGGSLSATSAVSANTTGEVTVVYTSAVADDNSIVNVRAKVVINSVEVASAIGSLVVRQPAATGPPHTITLSGPASVTAGQSSGIITLTVVDNGGIPVSVVGDTGFILTSSQESATATFSPGSTITVPAGSSSVTFTYANTRVGAGAHTITAARASGDALPGGQSATHDITVNAGALAGFEIKDTSGNDIGTQTAGVAFDVRIRAVDNQGNTVTSFIDTVTLTSNGTLTGAPITTGSFTNGELASYSVSITNVGSFTISASANDKTSSSNVFSVVSGPATQYLVNASSTNPVAGSVVTITAQLADQYGNPVTTQGQTVTWSSTGGGGFGSPTTDTDVNGVATVSFTTSTTAGTEHVVTATTGAVSGSGATITTRPGEATALLVTMPGQTFSQGTGNTGTPEDRMAAVPFDVQLRAVDGNNNVDPDYTGTRTITWSGPGNAPNSTSPVYTTSVEFVSGVVTGISTTLYQAQQAVTLTANDGTLAGTSAAFNVNAGVAEKLVFTTASRTITSADTSDEITVALRDANDNTAVAGTGGVTVALSAAPTGVTFRNAADNATITSVVIAEGASEATFRATGTAANSYTLTANAGAGDMTRTQAFTINAGAATQLVIGTIGSQTAGEGFAVTVTLADANGNPVVNAGADGTVTLTVGTGTGTLGGTVTGTIAIGESSVTFSGLTYNIAETGVVLTATGTGDDSLVAGKSGNSNAFDVTVGAAAQIRVETAADGSGSVVAAQDVTSGSSITVYAISRDGSGNFVGLVTDATWSLQNKTGGVADANLVAVDPANGSAVFTGALVGTAVIQASKTGLTSVDSGVITVVVGGANKLAFIQQPTTSVIGADITPSITVEILDVNGNRVTNNTSSVTLSIGENPGSGALSGTVTVNAIDGVVTFTGVSINKVGEGYTLSAASGSLTGATSSTFNMTAKTLTISGTFTANNKVYDGTTSATVDGAGLSLTGLVTGTTSVTLDLVGVFDTANVGEAKTVSLTGTTLSGTDAANYALSFVDAPTASADITSKALTITGLTGDNKVYDGTTTATATGTAVLSGVIGSDAGEVILGGTPIYTFASADVANGIEISTTGYTISGAPAGNYSLVQPTLSANITAADG
jgi:hypothetical protein